MNSNFDPSKYSLTATWFSGDVSELRLSDLAEVVELAKADPLRTVTSDCPNFGDLLEYLAPLCLDHEDEIKVNGVACIQAQRLDKSLCFVPEYWDDSISGNSIEWEPMPGAPVTFNQWEFLAKKGDFYWVEAGGDMARYRTYVGRFASDEEALPLLVQESTFHYFDEQGELHCEIDEWVEEQEAAEAEDDDEDDEEADDEAGSAAD